VALAGLTNLRLCAKLGAFAHPVNAKPRNKGKTNDQKPIGDTLMSIKKQMLAVLGGVALITAVAVATPPAGVILNQILATGATTDPDEGLNERFTVTNAAGDRWHLRLSTSGPSNFYVQDFIVGPHGYSGWHHHPGVLMLTVTEGSIDWYDGDCNKTTYTAGQSFTESNAVHDLVNSGSVNAHVFGAYITMKDESRRIENDQPACAQGLGLP
jgi:quercetin dioxygenase-like cupin family protein